MVELGVLASRQVQENQLETHMPVGEHEERSKEWVKHSELAGESYGMKVNR